jgi:NTE family protein
VGPDEPADELERGRADGVFEGGGVKGIAFAGALAAAEQEAGIREWVNVAGTSAGAIAACLVAAGYDAAGLSRVLRDADYRRFADYGPGGKYLGGLRNALTRRGLVPGEEFKRWLRECLRRSPLGKAEPTFADLERDDISPEATPEQREAARYRLRVIASDVSAGRMLVLPQDIQGYADDDGPLTPATLKVVDAVRMSMSYPFLFTPVVLHRDGKPVYVVDGGLLSNFPIWLFDSPNPKRPTWGFRLHGGQNVDEGLPYRRIPRPLWAVPLLKAMFSAATEAWDREQMEQVVSARTVSIPTHQVSTTNFGLSKAEAANLYDWGEHAAHAFFASPEQRAYLNSFGKTVETASPTGGAAPAAAEPELAKTS